MAEDDRGGVTDGPGARREAYPADALVVLVGPSGSGKSTWAASRFEADEMLSSDAYRAMVAGDAADQSATADAFQLLHLVAKVRLDRGLRCVIDATNLTARARRSLRQMAERSDRPVYVVVFDLSLQRCLAQNAERPDRRVPEDVVRRHHAQLQEALALLGGEGYREVRTLHDADMARA